MILQTQFSDQTRLISGVNLMRSLLDAPTKMGTAEMKTCRSVAIGIADACYFNVGWYGANPEKELKGSGATEKLFADIRVVTDFLQLHAKPYRGKGRPPVDELDPDYVPVLVEITLRGLENDTAAKREIILTAIREGGLKDRVKIKDGIRKTTTTQAHEKKVDRELKKLANRRADAAKAKTNNVLIFRQKKKPGR